MREILLLFSRKNEVLRLLRLETVFEVLFSFCCSDRLILKEMERDSFNLTQMERFEGRESNHACKNDQNGRSTTCHPQTPGKVSWLSSERSVTFESEVVLLFGFESRSSETVRTVVSDYHENDQHN